MDIKDINEVIYSDSDNDNIISSADSIRNRTDYEYLLSEKQFYKDEDLEFLDQSYEEALTKQYSSLIKYFNYKLAYNMDLSKNKINTLRYFKKSIQYENYQSAYQQYKRLSKEKLEEADEYINAQIKKDKLNMIKYIFELKIPIINDADTIENMVFEPNDKDFGYKILCNLTHSFSKNNFKKIEWVRWEFLIEFYLRVKKRNDIANFLISHLIYDL